MKHAILGAGATGTILAAALTKTGAEPLLIIGRAQGNPPSLTLVRDGLGRSITPAYSNGLAEGNPIDVLWIAPALQEALQTIRGNPQLVIPVLNGLDHMAQLRKRFPEAVRAATLVVEAARIAPGVVEQRSPFGRLQLADVSLSEQTRLATDLSEPGSMWGSSLTKPHCYGRRYFSTLPSRSSRALAGWTRANCAPVSQSARHF